MHILLTGGGSAGHVIPNIAIHDAIRISDPHVQISYIGSKGGIESRLCQEAGIDFEAIQTGKFRRYWDVRNFLDIFRVLIGTVQAFFKLLRSRPKVVFSKGGFVSFPVVFAAWLIGIPVFIHESDVTAGLATRLCAPFAKKIFLAHDSALAEFSCSYQKKLEVVGNPIRLSLLDGNKNRAKKWTGFNGARPVLLIMGGSTGAAELNERFDSEKEKLTEVYDVVHLTGEKMTLDKVEENKKAEHYFAIQFVGQEMKDLYALADLAISRAGANSLAELETLRIPALLFPLGRHASRGDQIENAQALVGKSSLYRIAEEEKSIRSQLLLLPRPRRSEAKANEPFEPKNTSTQKIAFTLLAT